MIICVFLSGCYTRKEACLDPLSANFDVTADDACPGDICCTYPKLTAEMKLMADDSVFTLGDTLLNQLNQKFRIIDFRCYFSDFTLYKDNGQKLKNIETISNADNTILINNDIILWKTEPGFTPGTFKTYGRFDSLTFYLGLHSITKNTSFSNLNDAHPLLENFRLKGKDGSITDMTLRCVRLISKPDTLSLAIRLDNPVLIRTHTIVHTNPGDEIKYTLAADVQALMKKTNLNLSVIEIESQIKSNILSSTFVK